MLASLPMYDWPEVREATDALWHAMASRLQVDIQLTRSPDAATLWRTPDLLLSQTCGYPLTHEFRGRLSYVATPHYQADGCDGPNYCSIVFAREKSSLSAFRGMRAAINTRDSMSGMLALRLVTAPLASGEPFLSEEIYSGSHRASMEMVRVGAADVCAIDAVCVALAKQHCPADLLGLVEIARSPSVPGLPFVTRQADPKPLQAALIDVMHDPKLQDVRHALLLKSVSELDFNAYDVICDLENAL